MGKDMREVTPLMDWQIVLDYAGKRWTEIFDDSEEI